MISKSGNNAFRGSIFEYKRDDGLDSASKYDDEKQELSLDQLGGSVGGPAQAGTFGYMLGPLNRTVGLGTARQTQVSLRYTF